MRLAIRLSIFALGVTLTTVAQTTTQQPPASKPTLAPFSRVGLEAGVSLMGINLQAATNMERHLNLRVNGNVFNYSKSNIETNGVTYSGKLNLASVGVDVDYYPFPTHGFRLSPGLLLYNQNTVSATGVVAGGTSFTVNGATYYSSAQNPVQATASIGLNANNPAFTLTTGWGNIISRTGGHLSFPFEIGAAFTGAPKPNIAFPSGQVCGSGFSGAVSNCVDVSTDKQFQSDVQAQTATYKSDLNVVGIYPIISFGIGYNFHVR